MRCIDIVMIPPLDILEQLFYIMLHRSKFHTFAVFRLSGSRRRLK